MKKCIFSFLTITLLSIGTVVFAQESTSATFYKSLVTIPGIDPNASTEGYVNALYFLSITIAALLAVFRIIYGGIQYMLSDVVTSKSEAIKSIRGALLGLLIVLGAVLILNTINVNLTTLNIFQNAPALAPFESTNNNPSSTVRIGDTYEVIDINSPVYTPGREAFVRNCPGAIEVDNSLLSINRRTYKCVASDGGGGF